jgi:hypothetical protein
MLVCSKAALHFSLNVTQTATAAPFWLQIAAVLGMTAPVGHPCCHCWAVWRRAHSTSLSGFSKPCRQASPPSSPGGKQLLCLTDPPFQPQVQKTCRSEQKQQHQERAAASSAAAAPWPGRGRPGCQCRRRWGRTPRAWTGCSVGEGMFERKSEQSSMMT